MSRPSLTQPPLSPGDPAPWFVQRSTSRDEYHFDTVAGRYIVLTFFASAVEASTRRMLTRLASRQDLFDDQHAAFFGVSCDPGDETNGRVHESLPGFRLIWDFDLAVSRLYRVLARRSAAKGRVGVVRASFILDVRLQIIAVLPMHDPEAHGDQIIRLIEQLPRKVESATAPNWAPVLMVPRVFEPEFCRQLIELFKATGGQDSGFMREVDGKTVGVIDYSHKRRRDLTIADESLRAEIGARIGRRLNSEVAKAFCFHPTRMERYIVACYDAEEGGYFRPHRDNTTKGTAHRRFAVTINLNADDYEGGDLRFPEYDNRVYRAPTGGAIVFSCSLLHEATPIVRGRRYAFLPFLYDEAAACVRIANVNHIADDRLRETVRMSVATPKVENDISFRSQKNGGADARSGKTASPETGLEQGQG